jgi:threonine dehydrogenase-like Zn-dependent dehydrogenase
VYALRFDGPRRVRIDDLPRPEPLEPGDAVVRVTTTSIEPADLERFAGPDPWGPVTPGGAFSGVVEATGPGVRRWRPGDAVVVPGSLQLPRSRFAGDHASPPPGPASDARPDWRGASAPADDLPVAFLGRDLPGSHAGWVRVPGADLILISLPDPANLDAQAVVAATAYAVGARAAALLRPASPRSVAVVGCDPSGLAFILARKTAKASHVDNLVAVDSIAPRVLLARRFGARGILLRGGDVLRGGEPGGRTEPSRFDAVVVGPKVEGASLELARDLAAPGAAIVLLDSPRTGWAAAPERLPAGCQLAGVPGYPEIESHIDSLRAGKLDLLPLISHTFPLADAPAAFGAALGRDRGIFKVLLKA